MCNPKKSSHKILGIVLNNRRKAQASICDFPQVRDYRPTLIVRTGDNEYATWFATVRRTVVQRATSRTYTETAHVSRCRMRPQDVSLFWMAIVLAKSKEYRIHYPKFNCVDTQSGEGRLLNCGVYKKANPAASTVGSPHKNVRAVHALPGRVEGYFMDVALARVSRFNFRVFLAQHLCAIDLRDSSCATLRTYWLGTQRSAGDEPMN